MVVRDTMRATRYDVGVVCDMIWVVCGMMWVVCGMIWVIWVIWVKLIASELSQ